ncbi:helix-turn-helix domain-containing protein [Bradyrhizobium genosp. P]|uniref:helix-turn-helix domain-containing protein n=1 Tax=Bradyrhizobium genosp. P TaxID=83641 RepID=UPI003CF0B8C8
MVLIPGMPVDLEAMVQQSSDFVGTPQMNFEEWSASLSPICAAGLLGSTCGGDHQATDRSAFAGWMRRVNVYGVAASEIKVQCGPAAADHGGNTYRFERTRRDVRLAGTDWYCASFQVAGRSTVVQNERTVQLSAGDIGLLDGARPSTRISDNGSQWLSIYLPRRPLISHLGFEPQTCLHGHGGTVAARILRQLVLDGIGDDGAQAASAGPHMRLAVYDLLGALFAPSDPGPVSRHADRLFARIRGVVMDRCADPDFGPAQVAAEAGISLRYVQKLLTARGCTCSELVYSVRLDRAARLLERRASLGARQHLSEIAYACGFRDYAHFARRFRDRFGHGPGAHLAKDGAIGPRIVHTRAPELLSSAQNV